MGDTVIGVRRFLACLRISPDEMTAAVPLQVTRACLRLVEHRRLFVGIFRHILARAKEAAPLQGAAAAAPPCAGSPRHHGGARTQTPGEHCGACVFVASVLCLVIG